MANANLTPEFLRRARERQHTHDVDLSSIRAGDEVLVRATVTKVYPEDQSLSVVANRDGSEWAVTGEFVVSHTPKALQVGDQVRIIGEAGVFEIEGASRHSLVYFCTRAEPLRHLVCHGSVLEHAP